MHGRNLWAERNSGPSCMIHSDLPLADGSDQTAGGWLGLLPCLSGSGDRRPDTTGAMEAGDRHRDRVNGGILLQQVVLQTMPVGEGVTLMATAPVMALFVGRMEGDPIQLSGIAAAVLALAGWPAPVSEDCFHRRSCSLVQGQHHQISTTPLIRAPGMVRAASNQLFKRGPTSGSATEALFPATRHGP